MVELRTRRRDERRWGKSLWEPGTKRILCPSQFTIPDTIGMTLIPKCNSTDTKFSEPNQESCTSDFSYPLESSTSLSSFSPISCMRVHHSTIIAEQKVKSSLSISPLHHHAFALSTAYTEYSIHRVQHPPKIACVPFILMMMSWPLNKASASSLPPYMIDRHQPARHQISQVKSSCHIPMFVGHLTAK